MNLVVTKHFPATLNYLASMIKFIQDYGCSRSICLADINKTVLAAEEALVNIILYGYPESPGLIEISCEEPPERGLKITIQDGGIPFNPLVDGAHRKTDLDTDMGPFQRLDSGGFGIFILLRSMDQVRYERVFDTNILQLIKFSSNSKS